MGPSWRRSDTPVVPGLPPGWAQLGVAPSWGWSLSFSCLCEAALLCSAPPWLLGLLCSSWIPLGGSQAVAPPGSGWEQGTVVPVLGSCHGRRQGCSGTGVLCPTEPRPPCLPCQPAQGCCDGGLGTPGSPPGPSGPVSWVMDTWIPPQDAGRSLVAPVSPEPTQLQPCADKSPITAGLGGFPPLFPIFQ